MDRYSGVAKCFGADVVERVRKTKVLVVGAGGIGCELLKTLVLSGFETITVIDLDTIDVSNLNRQFLFRKEHVGRPKAEVAKESALEFNPAATIVAHHGNVMKGEFGVNFFEAFDLCLNALDNIPARRHVNRLCLAADIPLVEAGTVGHDGQIQPIFKNKTRCYDCSEKPTPTTYPICTIRSTPEKPIHCIVWAKELFKLLFGESAKSMMFEADAQASKFMNLIKPAPEATSDAALRTWAASLFDALFGAEIKSKLDMGRYKGAATQPTPLSFSGLQAGAGAAGIGAAAGGLRDQQVLSQQQLAALFVDCAVQMWTGRRAAVGTITFDKDDNLAMDFVTAASNLRAAVFGISLLSGFDVKEMAGNIIPAVATSNAIVAGLQVLTALRIVAGRGDRCRDVGLRSMQSRKGMFLIPNGPEPPNPACFVCGTSIVRVETNLQTFTVRELAEKVLIGRLSLVAPSIVVHGKTIIYEHPVDEDDEDEDDAADRAILGAKSLAAAPGGGVSTGQMLKVEDMSQNMSCSIAVVHCDVVDDSEHPGGFILRGSVPKISDTTDTAAATSGVGAGAADDDDDDDDDDDVVVVANGNDRDAKRPQRPVNKRGPEAAAGGEVVDLTGEKRKAE